MHHSPVLSSNRRNRTGSQGLESHLETNNSPDGARVSGVAFERGRGASIRAIESLSTRSRGPTLTGGAALGEEMAEELDQNLGSGARRTRGAVALKVDTARYVFQ